MLSYNVKLNFNSQEDIERYSKTIELQKFTYNECSKCHFGNKKIV